MIPFKTLGAYPVKTYHIPKERMNEILIVKAVGCNTNIMVQQFKGMY